MEVLKPWTQLKLTKPVQKQRRHLQIWCIEILVWKHNVISVNGNCLVSGFFFFFFGEAGFWTPESQIRSLGINQGDETSMQQIRKTVRRWWTSKAYQSLPKQNNNKNSSYSLPKHPSQTAHLTNTTFCRIAATLQVLILLDVIPIKTKQITLTTDGIQMFLQTTISHELVHQQFVVTVRTIAH